MLFSLLVHTGIACAAQAGSIDRITPASARPGERVIITGNGFGARNVRITVGGVPAQVVSATGNQATFLVPNRVVPGATRVTATNPGGHSGSIGFVVLLGFTSDNAHSLQAVVGPNGRVLQTQSGSTSYTLTIPDGALDADTTIGLLPVTSIANLPNFLGGVAAAARLEPSGLHLHRPATLMIRLPGPVDTRGLLGFLVDNDGLKLEMFRVTGGASTIMLSLDHFSLGGAGTAPPQTPPSPPQTPQEAFAMAMQPLIDALPINLPPTQVISLVSLVAAWIERFDSDFSICTGTTLQSSATFRQSKEGVSISQRPSSLKCLSVRSTNSS